MRSNFGPFFPKIKISNSDFHAVSLAQVSLSIHLLVLTFNSGRGVFKHEIEDFKNLFPASTRVECQHYHLFPH